MSIVALTGANGFLGWHTRAALQEQGADVRSVPLGDAYDRHRALTAVDGSSRVVHLAGVNRASNVDVRDGNVGFAEQLASSLRESEAPPSVVVFANSTQAGNGSTYGDSKLKAAEILAAASADIGAEFIDVPLPNLFGEHGRPFYNAVTSTFCHLLASGETPNVDVDRELTLLHAQNAADLLIGTRILTDQHSLEKHETVTGLLRRLTDHAAVYASGEIPDVSDDFDRDLFNTYRSYTFPSQAPVRLARHADSRGSFFEIVRSLGGTAQSSFSTTAPGISRGDHFHRRKIERFTVLSGQATISLRRLLTDDVFEFAVTGDEPVAVDMPTMWAHRIANTGSDPLLTSFWSNEIFDPQSPDTIAEVV